VKTAWKGNTSVLLIWSDHFDCAMVNMLDLSAVDSGFDQGLGKKKNVTCFTSKHLGLTRRIKKSLLRIQENISE
jgi:hypothetical protein